MVESAIPENLGREMSHSREEVVGARNGVLEKDSMEEIEDRRLPAVIDLGLHSQGIFEIYEMSGNFRLEMIGGIPEKGHYQRPLTHSPPVDEVHIGDEEGVIGISIDAEEGPILKSGTMLHPEAGPATGIGKGKCAMTEIANVTLKPTGGRTTTEGNGRNAKGTIVSEGSNLFVQTPETQQVDNKPLSRLVQLQ